jgi:hypothetical protein
LLGHLVWLDTEVLHNNLLHSLGDVTHLFEPLLSVMGSIGGAIEAVVARPLKRFKRQEPEWLKRPDRSGWPFQNRDDGGVYCVADMASSPRPPRFPQPG